MPDNVPPEIVERARILAFLQNLADRTIPLAIKNPEASGAAQAALVYAVECIAANMHSAIEVQVSLARRDLLN